MPAPTNLAVLMGLLVSCAPAPSGPPDPRPPLESADTASTGGETGGAADTAPPWRRPEDTAPPRDPIDPLRDAALPGIHNVLMFSIDTLRRDDLGRYSGSDGTPFIDGLLAEGLALDNHRSTANWTYPALAAALSGRDNNSAGFVPDISKLSGSDELPPVPDDLLFLADHLSAAGYVTGLSGAQKFLEPSYGISTRYDHVETEVGAKASAVLDDAEVIHAALLADGRPWLHHIHFLDPHAPYAPPGRYVEDALAALAPLEWDLSDNNQFHAMIEQYSGLDEETRALVREHLLVLYDGELRYLDDQLQKLFNRLDTAGSLDETLVVIWSDHGEQFWEHGGLQHRAGLYGEETLALAGFWWRGAPGRALRAPTSHVDLVPTVLSFLGLSIDGPLSGRFAPDVPVTRPRFTQNIKGGHTGHSVDLGSERLHYEWSGAVELYDLETDPGEQRDLSGERPERVRALYTVLSSQIEALEAIYDDFEPAEPEL